MISRRSRALLYAVSRPLMQANAAYYRRFRAPSDGVVRVHLGPGRQNYLAGWINVDANPLSAKIDVWADLRNPLPFRDSTVSAIYSHHVIEHLPDVYFHFRDMFRILKPGGIFRVAGPDGGAAAKKLVEGDISWFSSDFPDKRTSLGGRYENFIYCGGEHLTVLTASFLNEVAAAAGFGPLTVRQPVTETGYPSLIDAGVLAKEWEDRPECPHTLVVEGHK